MLTRSPYTHVVGGAIVLAAVACLLLPVQAGVQDISSIRGACTVCTSQIEQGTCSTVSGWTGAACTRKWYDCNTTGGKATCRDETWCTSPGCNPVEKKECVITNVP